MPNTFVTLQSAMGKTEKQMPRDLIFNV